MNDHSKHVLALPSEVDGRSKPRNISVEIRAEIWEAVSLDDDLFADLMSLAMPEGKSGNRMFDQAMIANRLDFVLQLTTRYEGLTLKRIWDLFIYMMRQKGYDVHRGRVVGDSNVMLLENKHSDEPEAEPEAESEDDLDSQS